MSALFLRILNLSITAGWLVSAIILVRLAFKKIPKTFRVVLWAFVGIRLMFPFSFESVLSLIPSAETVPPEILYTDAPAIESGISVLNETVNPILSDKLAPTVGASVNPTQVVTEVVAHIWIMGMVFMAVYAVFSYLCVWRKVREAVPLEGNSWSVVHPSLLPTDKTRWGDHFSSLPANNIRLCDHISTPFILGVIHPRIYLPSTMSEQDMGYVIAHEKAHLKRRDHWWKPLGFLILTVHWFNPVLWVAYILFCRDIELACDEKVIRELGAESKKSYSDALINCSVPRRMIAACPLAFGEVGVKTRIKSVLNYKKPGFWIMVVGVVACIAVAVCFLSDPPGDGAQSGTEVSDDVTDADGERNPDDHSAQIPGSPATYVLKDSVDPFDPTILLNIDGHEGTFSFTYSGFSSYWPVGNYEVRNGELILRTGDGQNIYVFQIDGNNLIFDASQSSWIPEYRYSGDSYETTCPVPDGAVFERVEIPGADAVVKELPTLSLYGWKINQEATVGSYTWDYLGEDGQRHHSIADGSTMLAQADKLAEIRHDLKDYYLSSIDLSSISLSFEVMPDQVTVLAWRQEGEEAVSEIVPLEDMTFRMDFGVEVYEIIAKWDTSEYYNGEVHYGFRLWTPVVIPIP